MADRLKRGFPIMQGEISFSAAGFMLDNMVKPVFVTGSSFAPPQYQSRMANISSQMGY